ncbi:uncharacterized protein CCOS01_02586 [Colletotrichum costaricense]|uniref:Uncharacterized protein n=1 Tax=Colletotrichum costaricense TaxID=1209916 RepID=A0AAJ0E796_9PEZI|nr:uncharacterized protein CCOS01_02586 [Colletotrichum costaricense]KAK1537266.1 hypothetical protein CCOS01_02586 [Colletotrichum costaricense]
MRRNGRQDRPFSVTLRCGSRLLPAARIVWFGSCWAGINVPAAQCPLHSSCTFQNSSPSFGPSNRRIFDIVDISSSRRLFLMLLRRSSYPNVCSLIRRSFVSFSTRNRKNSQLYQCRRRCSNALPLWHEQ